MRFAGKPEAAGIAPSQAASHGSAASKLEFTDIALPQAAMRGSAAIAARLRRAIIDGVYTYGERLPPERELACSLGASRATVRNALDLLEERSFIRRKAGSGTFVVHGQGRDRDERDVADVTSPLELMDVREAIE